MAARLAKRNSQNKSKIEEVREELAVAREKLAEAISERARENVFDAAAKQGRGTLGADRKALLRRALPSLNVAGVSFTADLTTHKYFVALCRETDGRIRGVLLFFRHIQFP
jgi:hypothetical protein